MDIFNMKQLHPKAILPTRGTSLSAGLDLYACIEQKLTIPPGERRTIPIGIAVALPEGMVGLIYGRSGLGVKHGVTLANSVGVIDTDYRGELQVCLINQGVEAYTILPQDRIAQLVVAPVLFPQPEFVEELDATERAEGGFGSTGK